MTENDVLRETFNSAAQDYDAIRPGYPDALIEDVAALSGIPEGGRALEIGCGTGQATLPFARRGYAILCLDIGADLLAIAQEKLRAFPNVQFQHTAFEDWPLAPGIFDLVFSATAFHWIPREIGYAKAAQALKPGGALAVFANRPPRPFTGFAAEVQSVYHQYVPEWENPSEQPSLETEICETCAYIESTGIYSSVTVRTYPWTKTYTTREHLRLLNTYSDHLLLAEGRRRSLYQAIADLIERRYRGKVERPYVSVLYLAKK
jgi:SAM-dependent methyltransferase